MYVTDYGSSRASNLLGEWGAHISYECEFDSPSDMEASSGGAVYVTDQLNGWVRRFSVGG